MSGGLVHVYTGDGKGKTTASVGLAVRAAGSGTRVAFVQFVKGGPESGELASLRSLGVEVVRPAVHSSGLMTGAATDEDRAAAAEALESARSCLAGGYGLVVLDEVCVAAAHGLIETGELVEAVHSRARDVEVVLTGRGAPGPLLGIADYITEMRAIRHPFDAGVNARRGIEY